MAQQFHAFAGERHAARPPLEQHHSELLLQRLDADAERRLGDVQLLGGGQDRAAIGDDDEIAQVPQIHESQPGAPPADLSRSFLAITSPLAMSARARSATG